MKKLSLVFIASLFLTSAFAQSRGNQPSRVIYKAERVADKIAAEAYDLSDRDLRAISQLLDEIKDVIDYGSTRPPIDPRPRPPRAVLTYEAVCHVDNDPDFNFGQGTAGTLVGSIDSIVRDCKERAKAMYGVKGSSGVNTVKLIYFPSHFQTATCYIDDDPDFNFGQHLAGKVAGESIADMKAECQKIAYAAYSFNGSSGLKF